MADLTKGINANRIEGLTTLTGLLYFYEDRYEFKAHSVNGMSAESVIKYQDIENVSSRKTLGFISNGLTIRLKNGKEYHYVVSHSKEIIEFLGKRAK